MSNEPMPWDAWLETWVTHGKTSAFKRRLERSVAIAREGHEYTDASIYCALSGGKDGVALAGVLSLAGLHGVMHCHVHTELNTPGMRECAEKTAEQLDVDLDITEPELNIWDWLATSLPRGASLMDEPSHLAFRKQFSCGNLLVAYQYAHGFAGSYSGMRAEESRGRRMNRKIRGPLYQLRSDDTWACLPIVDWSARDVFACLVQLGLPIHPHYRLLSDRLGISPESPASRVDCMIPEDRVTKMPAGLQCKLLYPELWRRIITVRPELSAHGG